MNRIPDADLTKIPPDLAKSIKTTNLNLFKIWAYSAGTIKDVISLGADHYASLELPPHLRELIILLTAHVIECQYEWVQHVTPAKAFGVSDNQIDAIQKLEFSSKDFNEKELAAMNFSMAVLNNPYMTDSVFQQAQNNFTNREIVEMVELIGYYWMAGRIATVFKLDLDVPKSTEVSNSAHQFLNQSQN